jgi:hypothetical protein
VEDGMSDDGAILVLDIICGPCHRAGDANPPRLARFVRRRGGGPVGVQPFAVEGQQVVPYCHQRDDGGRTWRLMSECGHDKPIREERLVEAFEVLFPGDTTAVRVPL